MLGFQVVVEELHNETLVYIAAKYDGVSGEWNSHLVISSRRAIYWGRRDQEVSSMACR